MRLCTSPYSRLSPLWQLQSSHSVNWCDNVLILPRGTSRFSNADQNVQIWYNSIKRLTSPRMASKIWNVFVLPKTSQLTGSYPRGWEIASFTNYLEISYDYHRNYSLRWYFKSTPFPLWACYWTEGTLSYANAQSGRMLCKARVSVAPITLQLFEKPCVEGPDYLYLNSNTPQTLFKICTSWSLHELPVVQQCPRIYVTDNGRWYLSNSACSIISQREGVDT